MNNTDKMNRIIIAFQILFAMFAFCLTIFIGSIIRSEVSKLFWTAFVAGLIFSVIGRYLALVCYQIAFQEKTGNKDESSEKGSLINVVQEAEKPNPST